MKFWQKLTFFINTPSHLMMLCRKRLMKISSLFKVQNLNFIYSLKSNRTEQKFQGEVWSFSLNETGWKHRRDVLASVNGLQLMKAITAPLLNDLFWHGSIFVRPYFSVEQQQEFEYSSSYKAVTSEVSNWRTSPVINWLRIEKKLPKIVRQRRFFGWQILSCPRIKLWKSQTLKLEGVEVGILLSGFAQQLRGKNVDVSDIYFTLLDTAGKSPALVLNQKAKAKERGNGVFFKVRSSEAAIVVRAGWCCLCVCVQFSEN